MHSVGGLRRGLDSPDNDSAFSDHSFSSADSWSNRHVNRIRHLDIQQGHVPQQQGGQLQHLHGLQPGQVLQQTQGLHQAQVLQQGQVVHQGQVLQQAQAVNQTQALHQVQVQQQLQQLQLQEQPQVTQNPRQRVMSFTIHTWDGRSQAVRAEATSTTAADLVSELMLRTGANLDPSWSIVQCNHENHTERFLEDYELLSDSLTPSCSLLFAPRPAKYDLFRRPERYINDISANSSESLSEKRHRLLHSLFYGAEEQEMLEPLLNFDNSLYMKIENKRSWKRQQLVLRSSGLFLVPKGVKKSNNEFRMEDLNFVCDFVTHYLALGTNWKKKYKAPSESCFAMIKRSDAFQAANAEPLPEIVHFCAENDHVLFRFVTAIRLFRNGRQILMAYNRMLNGCQDQTDHCEREQKNENLNVNNANGMETTMGATLNATLSSLVSTTSSCSSESETSGCASEAGSEEESSSDFFGKLDNGTIKRKPNNLVMQEESNLNLVLPPPPPELLDSGSSLSLHTLPPPPEELRITALLESNSPQREQLYPCGAFRSVFPQTRPQTSQMELLKRINNCAPALNKEPNINHNNNTGDVSKAEVVVRTKRISFDEVVRHIDDGDCTSPLKGDPSASKVSQWILESSLHQSNFDQRPIIYNGRRVPNCYPPHAQNGAQQEQQEWARVPQPPLRSRETHLTPFGDQN